MRWKAAMAIGFVTLLSAAIVFVPVRPRDVLADFHGRTMGDRVVSYYKEHVPGGRLEYVRTEGIRVNGVHIDDFKKLAGTDEASMMVDGAHAYYSASTIDNIGLTYNSMNSLTLQSRQALNWREVLWVRMTNLGLDPFE